MTRKDFLIGVGVSCLGFFLAGCGGGQNTISVPKLSIRIVLNTFTTTYDRTAYVDPNTSLLEAIQQVYSYSRLAPITDLEQTTIIESTSGHWQYTVNNSIPQDYVGDYIINSDNIVELSLI